MNLKLLKKTITTSKNYFGSKLIPENQNITFDWVKYPYETSNILSKLIVLNEKYHNPDINIDSYYDSIKNIIERDSIKRINLLKNYCFLSDLPSFKRTFNEVQTSSYYYFTTLLLINFVIKLRYEKKDPISDEEFDVMYLFLTYKQSTAIKKMFDYGLDKINAYYNDEDVDCTLNYIIENENYLFDLKLEHNINSDLRLKIEDFYRGIKNGNS